MNIRVHAGHDLSQKNLFDLLKAVPEIKEVSIGQALIAKALEDGLSSTVKNDICVLLIRLIPLVCERFLYCSCLKIQELYTLVAGL